MTPDFGILRSVSGVGVPQPPMPISNWQPNLKGHITKITSSHRAEAQILRCRMHSSGLILHELAH